jgi:hypothetical protein
MDNQHDLIKDDTSVLEFVEFIVGRGVLPGRASEVLQHEVVGVFLTKYRENTMLEPMRQGADI